MKNFDGLDLIRLRKDKDFATDILLYRSHELLREAYYLYSKEPEAMKDIINSIGYSIDKL